MNLRISPLPPRDSFITNLLVVSDQDRSRESYKDPFGLIVIERDPVIMGVAKWEQLNEKR